MAQKSKKQYQPQRTVVTTTTTGTPVAKPQAPRPERTQSKPFQEFGIFGIILIALYCFVDFVPSLGSNDNMAIEWYYVSIINVLVGLFIFFSFKQYQPVIENIVNQLLSKVYFVFCGIAALSIFYAINQTEAWVCYIRVLNTVIAFFNIAVLLKNRKEHFIYLAALISLLVFFQSWQTLSQFFKDLKSSTDINSIIYNLKEHAGNKNILAASMVIKMPFLLYSIYYFKNWAKYLFSLMLVSVLMAVIIINARTAYISLILEILFFIIFCGLWYLKTKNIKIASINTACIVIPAIVAFLYTNNIFSKLSEKSATQNASGYGGVAQRLSGNLASGSGGQRLSFWKHAISYIKDNPIMGAGIGNWKLADIPYDINTENDFSFAKHAHNDFLQVPAETGIPGGLAFYAIFIVAIYNVWRVIKSDKTENEKLISLVSFFMIGAYMIDAALNFPHERPVMQVYLALALAINLSGLVSDIKVPTIYQAKDIIKIAPAFTLVLALVATYYGKLNFETSKYQYVSNKELFADPKRPAKFDNNSKYNGFPNLADNNYPIDVVRAFNAHHLGDNQEAIRLLNGSTQVNPYSMSNEYMKAIIYNSVNQMDSAMYYAKKGTYARPRNLYFFRIFADVCVKMKDTTALQNAMLHVIPYNNDARMLDYYAYWMINMKASRQKYEQVLSAAEKKWPDNEDIEYKRFYINAILASSKGDNKIALENLLKLAKKYPTNYAYKQDIGAIYYTMKDFKSAHKFLDDVIANNGSINGKAEFFLGNLLLLEAKKDQACPILKKAVDANYPDAKRIYDANACFNVAAPAPAMQPQQPAGLPKKFFP